MVMSMLEVRLDFISCTREFDSLAAIREAIDSILSFVAGDGSDRWGYLDSKGSSRQLKSCSGLMGWERVLKGDEPNYHLRLEMPGQFCGVVDQNSLCSYLDSEVFHITRLDVCLDDYLRRVSFSEVKSAGDAGYYRLVQFFKSIESSIIPGSPPVGTCYFGNSDKIVRFYDADYIHGIPADRWELQLREDHARSAFSLFCSEPDCLASLVVGAIDLGIPGHHYRDFCRFPWWQSLIDSIGSARPTPVERYSPDLSRAIKWLDTSVAPTLAVLRSGLGSGFDDLLAALCDSGSERFKPYHRKWIESIQLGSVDVYDVLTKNQGNSDNV